MRDKRRIRLVALAAALTLLAAACGGDSGGGGGSTDGGTSNQSSDKPTKGGRMRWISEGDTDYVDPTATYYTVGISMHRGVSRQLTNYPNTANPDEQIQPVPDLATDLGTPNDDFTQWEYTLKDGVKWGLALGGEEVPGVTGEAITCDDVKYGIERQFIASVGAQYNFYYPIEGATEFSEGKADEVTGLKCADDKTIQITLTEPLPDLDFRMAMPATTPVPKSYAQTFDKKKDSDYDLHVVSSGPYYISDYTPGESMKLDRNEHWDPATDDIREAYVDGVDWKMGFENDVAVQKLVDNDYDMPVDVGPLGPQLEQIVTDPELQSRFINEANDCTYYTFLNTTVEPFDNPEVRAAVNFAIDRANLVKLRGGKISGPVATSTLPPGVSGYLPADEFNPFETPGMSGDIEKAKQMMADAGYPDGFHEPLLMVGASGPPTEQINESIRQDLTKLGIDNFEIKLPESPNHYSQFYGIPSKNVAIGTAAGWCKDWADATTYLDPLFNGANILQSGNSNYAEADIPELNKAIEDANGTPPGPERVAAWEEANRLATESGVWIPYQWSFEKIVLSERVVGAFFHASFTQIDWVNSGIAE